MELSVLIADLSCGLEALIGSSFTRMLKLDSFFGGDYVSAPYKSTVVKNVLSLTASDSYILSSVYLLASCNEIDEARNVFF